MRTALVVKCCVLNCAKQLSVPSRSAGCIFGVYAASWPLDNCLMAHSQVSACQYFTHTCMHACTVAVSCILTAMYHLYKVQVGFSSCNTSPKTSSASSSDSASPLFAAAVSKADTASGYSWPKASFACMTALSTSIV